MRLIITEKDNAARRIAEILSEGGASANRRNGVNVYRWGNTRVVGLSGHVVGVDFPEEYNDWRDVEPVELIDADVTKEPTQENIVTTLKQLAREADEATIATDYDREGELIGKEAYELIREETDAPVDRVRFSSITEREVRDAFANPDDIDFDLAAAGEARQIIDLVWGAALTRFLSLSARQLGDDFISVGRVQSPTLKLIVDREREIQAFDPEDYWEIFADLQKNGSGFEAQYFYDDDGKEAERVWVEDDADDAYADLTNVDAATVTSVRRRTRTDSPPTPFNTTAFISAASSLGYSAQQAMSIAEELYTTGYITYPRTDNTVYPDDLEEDALLDEFVGAGHFGEDAEKLLEQDDITATKGDEETTDHPPIHPTGEIPPKADLSDDEWEIYELVVRRFFATVAEAATWEHLRVVADAGGRSLKANGKRLVEPGYHEVYPYSSASENHVPDVEEGEELAISEVRMEAKQTQPPRRYGQSRLIQTMEDKGLGTKCLTADSDVLVRSENGDIERQTVDSLFSDGQVVLADGDTDIAVSKETPTVLSLDEATERVSEQESTLVSERPLRDDESVRTIETSRGAVTVTDDHPMYIRQDGEVTVRPASDIEAGTDLVAARRPPDTMVEPSDETVLSWETFAADCDKHSKLYGVDCGTELAAQRAARDESQTAFAERYGSYGSAVGKYERGEKDVPVWLLGELDIRPDRIHGLNYETSFENPFPLEWSPELAQVIGCLLGDGSIHRNDDENVVDVRYHNTDEALIERFARDIERLFDIEPTVTDRPGRESHHKRKYQVDVPSAVGRVLVCVLEAVTENGTPVLPDAVRPAFVGALFDDEGHISREGKAFISNTDHTLLTGVGEMLAEMGIETKLAPDQHKLHIRGRRNLEQFLDRIPIASDEKFYRGLDALDAYDVTTRKAELLEAIRQEPKTSAALAQTLGVTRGSVNKYLRELRESGHIEKQIEGSNRSLDENRTVQYVAADFEGSVYATLRGEPSSVTVEDVERREYDGPVYDLTVSENAPNFAVNGGAVVHNSTRHNSIEKLYDRGYIEGDPPRPTTLAMAVVEAAEEFADHVVSDEMTAQLEADMTAIANGEATLDEVADESREMLKRVFDELRDSREEIGEHLQESLKADKTLGPCPKCGEDMLVRRSRQGSYFVGCDGFPECRNTLPLPSTGEPQVLEDHCEEHDMHHVKMLAGRDTFVHGCPRCKAEKADESEDEVIGPCPECGSEHDGDLAIKHLRSGSRLVGCTRYPDCDYSLPLPRNGDISVTEAFCEEHDLPELVIDADSDDPWELGCPICNYEEYQARTAIEDLEDLNGIGSATAEKLGDAGVDSLAALREADPDIVATEVQGVSATQVRDWQDELEA
ncbi:MULTISPECIES: DNA topoisomerase I [Haloarcula]|uniref:DNA topoisomerase I n=1 Tax=Haloarcula TaxID=2237 RepID=UPI000F8E1CFA|nr:MULTISPECIES: DNA topoisomerase I [Haloarcula]NHX40726.1 DNA topoisomerase I [Haloarcula sp. R1-2]